MNESRFILFTGLLNSAGKSIQHMKAIKMERYGLSAAHTNCIYRLADHPEGLTQRQLTDLESMDRAQVSRVLCELEQKGYVHRKGDTGAYKRCYELTSEGRQIGEEIQSMILGINQFVSRQIPPSDLEVFYRTMGMICENLRRAEEHLHDGKEP